LEGRQITICLISSVGQNNEGTMSAVEFGETMTGSFDVGADIVECDDDWSRPIIGIATGILLSSAVWVLIGLITYSVMI
jgi:hypothetical protein